MKNIFFLAAAFTTCTTLWAQKDNGPKGGIAIPRATTPDISVKPSSTTISPDSPFKAKPEEKKSFNYTSFSVGEKKPNFSMNQTDQFVNRSSEFTKRTEVPQQGESNAPYKGNMDFGMVKTKSPYVVLNARDFGAEDGDRVKITLNDKVIISDMTLTYNSNPIMINLSDGFNDIRIEALNQGTSGPNTAQFNVYDNKDSILASSEWNLATGFHGKFLIVKEP